MLQKPENQDLSETLRKPEKGKQHPSETLKELESLFLTRPYIDFTVVSLLLSGSLPKDDRFRKKKVKQFNLI